MRKFLTTFIKDSIFIHADMWDNNKFPLDTSNTIIDVGLSEASAINIAAGLLLDKEPKTIYIYGVAGFMIHRHEQIKFSLKEAKKVNPESNVIFLNAGAVGYDKFGESHMLTDDLELMAIHKIQCYQPQTVDDILNDLLDILLTMDGNGSINYIRLGKDQS